MGLVNLGRVKGSDGADGINVYVKFNSAPEDANATDSLVDGQKYIGILSSNSAVKPVSGHAWIKFVGDDGTPGTAPYIVQTTGTNTTAVMSQNAVTNAITSALGQALNGSY